MPNYKVKMTIYYEFEGVEADNEEHAKEAIVDEDWDRHIKDVIFDVEEETEDDTQSSTYPRNKR